jgi:hypothetical protein
MKAGQEVELKARLLQRLDSSPLANKEIEFNIKGRIIRSPARITTVGQE